MKIEGKLEFSHANVAHYYFSPVGIKEPKRRKET
jgi:hypothetical protein